MDNYFYITLLFYIVEKKAQWKNKFRSIEVEITIRGQNLLLKVKILIQYQTPNYILIRGQNNKFEVRAEIWGQNLKFEVKISNLRSKSQIWGQNLKFEVKIFNFRSKKSCQLEVKIINLRSKCLIWAQSMIFRQDPN